MALAKDYRPDRLDDFYGNDQLKKDLLPFVKGKRPMPQAMLLTGGSGCGKTTLARICAKAIGCSESDIVELDIADFRGIDTVRDIRKQMRMAPLGGDRRCWILDEVHKMTDDAQNALLKALEEPPSFVNFILCTTDPQKLIKTIVTRCVQFEVEPLSTSALVEILKDVCHGENKKVPDTVLTSIAKSAGSSGRAAINALERVLGRDPGDYDKEIDSFDAKEAQVRDLCQALLARKKWVQVAKIVSNIKEEPESVRRACLGYMNAILLSGKDSVQAANIIECFKEPLYNSGKAGLTLACYYAILQDS